MAPTPGAGPQVQAWPGPTETPTAKNYPNLDETLQALVRKYELRELTAEQAAAEAFVYEGSKVLIRVALSSSGNTSVDSWMGTQDINPRAQVDYSGGIIYAYAEVSVLGALSQQAGLTKVHAEPAFLGGAIFGEQLPPLSLQPANGLRLSLTKPLPIPGFFSKPSVS